MPRFLSVSEPDPDFRAKFTAHLLSQGAVPILFELPDTFTDSQDVFPGAKVFITEGHAQAVAQTLPAPAPAPSAPAPAPSWLERNADVVDWLNAYRGDFPFYLSLRDQLQRRGELSEKQVDAVKRAILRDPVKPPIKPEDFTLKAGTAILLTQWRAQEIARAAGMDHAFRVMDVLEVRQETDKAYQARVRFSARRTPFCGICGQELTNPDSQAAGIGPICAENWGLPYGEASLEGLDAKLRTLGERLEWIPKRSILKRFDSSSSVSVSETETLKGN